MRFSGADSKLSPICVVIAVGWPRTAACDLKLTTVFHRLPQRPRPQVSCFDFFSQSSSVYARSTRNLINIMFWYLTMTMRAYPHLRDGNAYPSRYTRVSSKSLGKSTAFGSALVGQLY